jgi:hypothetical protein
MRFIKISLPELVSGFLRWRFWLERLEVIMAVPLEISLISDSQKGQVTLVFSGDESWGEYVARHPACWVTLEAYQFDSQQAAQKVARILVKQLTKLKLGRVSESEVSVKKVSLMLENKHASGTFSQDSRNKIKEVIKEVSQKNLGVKIYNPWESLS